MTGAGSLGFRGAAAAGASPGRHSPPLCSAADARNPPAQPTALNANRTGMPSRVWLLGLQCPDTRPGLFLVVIPWPAGSGKRRISGRVRHAEPSSLARPAKESRAENQSH